METEFEIQDSEKYLLSEIKKSKLGSALPDTVLTLLDGQLMHASVLVILCEGHETLEAYESEVAARDALLRFVDQRWSGRFGSLVPPLDRQARVDAFFKGEGIYLVARADLTDVHQQVETMARERSLPLAMIGPAKRTSSSSE